MRAGARYVRSSDRAHRRRARAAGQGHGWRRSSSARRWPRSARCPCAGWRPRHRHSDRAISDRPRAARGAGRARGARARAGGAARRTCAPAPGRRRGSAGDLGALQALFVRDAASASWAPRHRSSSREAAAKLAEIFGSIHGAVAAELTGLGATRRRARPGHRVRRARPSSTECLAAPARRAAPLRPPVLARAGRRRRPRRGSTTPTAATRATGCSRQSRRSCAASCATPTARSGSRRTSSRSSPPHRAPTGWPRWPGGWPQLIASSQAADGPRIAIAAGRRRLPGRRGQRRAPARERRRGDLRREGVRRTGRPQRRTGRRDSCKIRSAPSENLVVVARTC